MINGKAILTQITSSIDQKFITLGESMIVQMAIGPVKAKHAALRMDNGTS